MKHFPQCDNIVTKYIMVLKIGLIFLIQNII